MFKNDMPEVLKGAKPMGAFHGHFPVLVQLVKIKMERTDTLFWFQCFGTEILTLFSKINISILVASCVIT